ncbi:pentatricopeptide repeat-containing protein At1g80150, mitochondrial [Impatiens glandulifera]|uniref:pentatricopeptide repeat-containing protein At1g80150, mitochondrial n=1 Tax=Impatiens glandulifera TaxID=253017 RepID=UPI001FB0CF57|nr:pentatricopeptide repeat-containing protein At1g80150, mitochondrial [Impatiens glandulifera]
MLSLRLIRRYGATSLDATTKIAGSSVPSNVQQTLKNIEEPALIKLKKERDPDKLFHLFKANAINRLVVENRFAFEDTVSRLSGARRFDYIEDLLEQQKALPQGRREGFVIRIIMLYGSAGMIKHAIDTFYNMHLYGCSRTVKSFNAALKVLSQSRDLEALQSFLSEVPFKLDIQIDILSVNIVVKVFCDMSLLDKAYLIMTEMEKCGIKPDVYTYTTLMSAAYKMNSCEIGNGLWNLMVQMGCLPNLATFNVRIQYLVSKGRAWQANSLLSLMWYIGILPDLVTYNLVIKGFCRARSLEMAKRVYSALHSKGYKPNLKIYQTMVHYACKEEDFDMAYKMCTDSMKKNWFPNVDTIFSLLEGLRKKGELDKAKTLFKLAGTRVPPFPMEQLDALQSILSKS